jgi:hypothetical protein
VHPQAISEWLKQPHFHAALDSLRTELINQATEQIKALTAESVHVLRDVLRSGNPALRLRAAMYTLDRVLLVAESERGGRSTTLGPEVDAERLLDSIGIAP